jgi:hypothetical protein
MPMKKYIALLLALCAALGLAACAGTTEEPLELNLEQIYGAMANATDETMTPINPGWLLDMYGIIPEDCEEAYVYSYNSGIMAAEIWLIKATSPEALARLKTLAENRLTALDNQSASYSPEMNKVVKKAQIITRGDYIALIISSNVEALAEIFNNAN